MKKYKVLQDLEIKDEKDPLFGSHAPGSVIEMEDAQAALFIEHGIIELEPVEPPAPPVMVDYVVLKGPFANPEGEVFQTGNDIKLPENDKFASDAVTAGLIVLKSEYVAPPKPAVSATPTTPAVAGATEPRLRYRGHVVISDGKRSVGRQTFHHIRTDEGHEYDLTPAEYAAEVKLAYPPQN